MKGDDFLKELHTDDLSMNSGKLFREQMIENFEAIERELTNLKGINAKLKKLQNALGLSDDDLKEL